MQAGLTDPLSRARIVPTAFSCKEEYTLRWNTEGVPPGNYALKAILSEVPHETNVTNNVQVSENTVVILMEGRDIALTAVNLSKTAVGQGFPLVVNLTVRNFGNVQEAFNITLYANETVIETLTATVANRTVTLMSCCWNTTGFAKGTYILSANASSVPEELDTSDNASADHTVFVTIAGDVDGDKDVDLSDAMEFVRCYRVHPILNPNADFDEDRDIDIYDAVILCGNYGKNW
jgi:hypothetical protein